MDGDDLHYEEILKAHSIKGGKKRTSSASVNSETSKRRKNDLGRGLLHNKVTPTDMICFMRTQPVYDACVRCHMCCIASCWLLMACNCMGQCVARPLHSNYNIIYNES